MKKNLTKNIPLKIMSIIVGILVWLIVVNVDDPIITKGFVISDVQIINEAYVDQLGKMVMQDDRENSVRVYITGERKIVNRLTSSDIKAVADLQQAQSTDTDPVMIPYSNLFRDTSREYPGVTAESKCPSGKKGDQGICDQRYQ